MTPTFFFVDWSISQREVTKTHKVIDGIETTHYKWDHEQVICIESTFMPRYDGEKPPDNPIAWHTYTLQDRNLDDVYELRTFKPQFLERAKEIQELEQKIIEAYHPTKNKE